ncbi:MAG: flagellar hook protein FlgE [Gallionella sp.]|nr:flagellar hook protein FlgE [Gallionella sp.]MDD4945738.1 flagellar hook protein FlgE [Gallionella sp.]MDD5612925.1 flagellar hook protein FlgE [Gallionella sp.]
MSFQQGLSGLNASSKHLDTIGNNVANASTVGFKQSQAQFADMFAVSLSGAGVTQIGTGTKVAAVAQQFTQGNITNTNNPMDTAISGQGFFRVTDATGAVLYSRNGQFQVDKNGFMVNNQGHKVSGYLPNAAGAIIPAQPVPLQLNAADLMPNPTLNAIVGANLDSRAAVPLTAVFNPADPTSYNSSTSLTVYDSLGASHVGSLYFQRQPILPTTAPAIVPAASTTMTVASALGMAVGNTVTIPGAGPAGAALTATISGIAGNVLTFTPATTTATVAGAVIASNAPSPSWKSFLTVDGVSVAGAATPEIATLNFDALGKLVSTTPVSAPVGKVTSAALFPLSTTVSTTQTLTFDFGSPTAATSQYGGNFGVNTLTQDGYTSGRLNSISTSQDGTILGRYSNGQSRAMGQILLANFTSPQGLQPVGNNEWVETSASGGPLVGVPGSSSLGMLQSSATEDSNVDLTAELVNMITAQRVYQANAQTIKAQDQILQTIVSLR